MYEINPFTGNSVSTNSRRYDDICKTGIYNYTIPIKAEMKDRSSFEGNRRNGYLNPITKGW